MSSLAVRPFQQEVVCLWEGGVLKTERVNGFYDAVKHVWKAEGVRGLWKGVGTSLYVPPVFCLAVLTFRQRHCRAVFNGIYPCV